MSDLEHLIENTLVRMKNKELSAYQIKQEIINDPNFAGTNLSAADVWDICQYIMYTWCAHCHEKEENDMAISNKDYKRKIITLCGSSRFKDVFHKVASEYTLMGYIVLMPHCYFENNARPDLKDVLVDVHRDMISMSDEVLVINPGGYMGESTKEEIKWAEAQNKVVKYYEEPTEVLADKYKGDLSPYLTSTDEGSGLKNLNRGLV